MIKPVILTTDDDPNVLEAVARDLRRQYGKNFRIIRAESGQIALASAQALKARHETVAIFVADQRMPGMSGVELLEKVIDLFPVAKRVLLTAYADTDAAIQAINAARLDYYLLKPWDPPEEKLYPVLDDLIQDWLATYRPPFSGIRVVSDRWSPSSHQLRDFLARNQIPYRWLDIEKMAEAQALVGERLAGQGLPLVILADGERLYQPTTMQLANKVGLQTQARNLFYDLVIVGGGPAGLAAAVYGASEGLKTVMIERQAPGGQAGTSSRIENYLGFPSGLSGDDLARRAVTQAKRFGVEILTPQSAQAIRTEANYRILTLQDGTEISCHALILAMGVSWRRLLIPGIDALTGAGVYYGAAQTEAAACENESVFIVGGANSAGQAAMHFSRFAHQVTMLVRGASLTHSMSQYLIAQIAQTDNIVVSTHSEVVAVKGDSRLKEIVVKNNQTGEETTLLTPSLFIFIGAVPSTDWLNPLIERDAKGFILTGPDLPAGMSAPPQWPLERPPFLLETNIPGIFAVGDVRHGSIKRVASGVGEGSICVQFVHQHLAQI